VVGIERAVKGVGRGAVKVRVAKNKSSKKIKSSKESKSSREIESSR
jgi:hypothetical protein